MRKFPLCFIALLWCVTGHAQNNYRVESITVADGLSQGFVMSMLEDSRGFIWASTFNGLNRYDGYQVKRFTPDNTNPWSLMTNFIYCMAEDTNGLLWMGTDLGVVVMDPYTERFIQLAAIDPAFPYVDILSMQIKDGRIWISDRKAGETNNDPGNMYVVTAVPDLPRLMRENRVSVDAFTIRPIIVAPGLQGSFQLLYSNTAEIAAIDRVGQLCKINPATLHMERVGIQALDYQRLGNYGLLHYDKHGGFIFRIPEVPVPAQRINTLAQFIQLSGQMPLLYATGDSILYQFDTLSVAPRGLARGDQAGLPRFKPFITLDQPISCKGIVDRKGNFWMGTNGYGMRTLRSKKIEFRHYVPKRSFYNFSFLPDGRVWPGRDFPKKVLNLQTNKFEAAPWAAACTEVNQMYNLCITRSGDWWLPNSQKGRLFILKKEHRNGQWTTIPLDLEFIEYRPVQILEDRSGNIWVSATGGQILRIDPHTNQTVYWQFDQFFPEQIREGLRTNCLVKDSSGTLWLGCNHGLVRIRNPEATPVFDVWHNHTSKGALFKNERVISLYPDPNNPQLIWIGTYGGGLHCFDSAKDTFKILTEKDGLVDNVVYGILPDAFGYLWLSTNRGLSRFNPKNRTFYNFTHEDPILNTEFNTDAFLQMPSGDLAFGSINGLFIVHPLADQPADQSCVVAVTELKINSAVVNPSLDNPYLTVNAQNELVLRVPYEKNSVAVEFAALQTGDPASAQFRYRMLGLDRHWIHAGLQRTANFALIPPGQYTLELQSINANGSWDDAPTTRLYVTVLPPWYRSWAAWFTYLGLLLLLLYGYVRYERRNFQLKHAENMSRKEMERLKSLDDFKNRFFGSISHEFKTPLTIILGQAKRLLAEQNLQGVHINAGAILQQGQSMLEMVDQIVDITKFDNEDVHPNWRNGNFSDYMRYLVESLRPLATFKNIQLDFHTELPDLVMDFDPQRLKYIVSNLLNNAVRYTPSGEFIAVSIYADGQDRVMLEIMDTGEGIAAEDLPHIFTRYYQGASQAAQQQQHFGIGLTFVKDLVQLFGGTICVSSQRDNGTLFTISLPITRQGAPLEITNLDPAPEVTAYHPPTTDELPQEALPLLLIVEDNPFISKFVAASLHAYFTIELAADGLAGYEKALEIIPDLILTDVMMPGMDGYELTHQIKSHELTSHIPIVILSARSELADRLTGQQYGANAYIAKPFDAQELILTLKNLHHLQYRWRERYAGLTTQTGTINQEAGKHPEEAAETLQYTDAFMLKIYAIFAKKYTDEAYDLPQLCRDIEMSKSQLQRKLVALSDQSAMQLLRRYRLQRAFEILSENPDQNVKEVCFQVGFKDPSHFSRLFSKTFHTAPSDVKRNSTAN